MFLFRTPISFDIGDAAKMTGSVFLVSHVRDVRDVRDVLDVGDERSGLADRAVHWHPFSIGRSRLHMAEVQRRRPGEGQEKARFFRCKDAQTRQNEANNVQDLAQSLTALQDKAAQDVVYFLDFLFKMSFRLEREGI